MTRDKKPKGDYNDPFSPPDTNIKVRCIHCEREYKVWEMKYEKSFWCCKFEDCDGVGYGYDILRSRY